MSGGLVVALQYLAGTLLAMFFGTIGVIMLPVVYYYEIRGRKPC